MTESKKIKGRINIDADDEGLIAVLHFVPDDNGIEFDVSAINRLIAEKQLVFGVDRKALDEKIDALLSSPGEITITVAEGEPFQKPEATEYVWAAVSIPEDIRSDVERVLRNAAPPEIYRVEVEKVEQEKTVKKKGLIPFGKEKEEKVTEVVKREKRIRVDVLPDVLEAGWVESGVKIADIKPGSAGSAGRDVFGRPIQPPSIDEEFWSGRGIDRKGNSLVTSQAGILRRGLNWVEVFPFKKHDWSLELSKDKNTCFLNFNPGGAESSAPDLEEIFKRAEMIGCPADTLVVEERLKQIIHTSISSGKVLSRAVISTDDDGLFDIKISDNGLKAELSMHKSRGNGKPLVLKEVGSAIKKSGLKSLDLKKIQETILEFYNGPDKDIIFTLTEGAAAENNEAGEIVYELEFMKQDSADEIKKRAALLDEAYLSAFESSAEYPPTEASYLALVQKDQKIAALPVPDGKKGTDVYGKEIEPESANISEYQALENVKIENGAVISETSGLLERFEKDGKTAYRIRAHQDSGFRVRLSSDRMTAMLSAEPAAGTGAPPSLEDANRLIEEAGVTNGIDADALRSVVDRCREGESVTDEPVARGKEPRNAGDAEIKFLVKLAGGEAVSIDENGRANYRKQNKLSGISEGERIAEIKVVEGNSEDGWDVQGKVLSAKKSAPVNIEIGANIREEKEDNGYTFLVAGKSGRLVYENNRLEIQESLNIKGDVDFGSGNIKFGGDVNIKGNVKNGFFVMAAGNIVIGMNSEMSLLSSDKSITVVQGVKGGGKAVLRAKESIQLSFAERATLLAVANITVKNAVFGCKVKCNGKLRLVSEKGYLVGGRIQAREGVEAANIGSISGSRTEVSFGQDYLISDKIETEEKEINKIKTRLIKIDPEMRLLEKAGDKTRLTKLRMEKVKMMKILEKRSMRVFTLKERFEQHFPAEVVIRGDVFPGVIFESHGRTLEITKNEKAVKIIFNQENGILEKVPLSGGNGPE